MCLILFAHQVHPEYRLLLAANRDEMHERPTAPAQHWKDAPEVLGGRDLVSGGTWLGVTAAGRWAAVTNFRDPEPRGPYRTSRGHLVADFLKLPVPAATYAAAVMARAEEFDGFNLILGDMEGVIWVTNRSGGGGGVRHARLTPGVYGIANDQLDTPWPKVTGGKRDMAALLGRNEPPSARSLLALLQDRTPASDPDLAPGMASLEIERALSARFIANPIFGTRSSTALLIAHDGAIHLTERHFDATGVTVGEVEHELPQPSPGSAG